MMKHVLFTLLTAGIFVGNPTALESRAQDPTLLAQSELNCSAVESLGTELKPVILSRINEEVSGANHRINRRKTLVINRVQDVSFQGCKIILKLDVVLKRKIRRDAAGVVELQGEISSFDLQKRKLCYKNAKVSNVNLSRTLSIGEGFYRWVANLVLPNNGCFRG